MVEIPIVDFSAIVGHFENVNDDNYQRVAKELGAAMGSVGFAYIVNHGVDLKKLELVYKLCKDFFQLPIEIKRKFKKTDPVKSYHGYSGPGDEFLNENEKNSTELKELIDFWGQDVHDEKNFPEEIPGMKAAVDDIRIDMEICAKKILKCLGKYLNMDGKLKDEDFFVKRHKNLDDNSVKSHTQFRTLYYYTLNPNDSHPEDVIRCGDHSDWGSITLLFQDMVGGLEVRSSTGKWIPATPIKDAILLNSGQLMEFWTAGELHAARHRVRILTEGRPATDSRQSFVYFVNPDGDEKIFPVVPISPGREEFSTRPPVIAFDYYQRRIENAALY